MIVEYCRYTNISITSNLSKKAKFKLDVDKKMREVACIAAQACCVSLSVLSHHTKYAVALSCDQTGFASHGLKNRI